MADATYDVIVVGAGLGGSTCAGLLARRGLKVLLVEKNSRPGGKAMSISKNGFTYTAWVVIGAPVVGNLYEAVGRELGVEDLFHLVTPGAPASLYRTSSGAYARVPDMPIGQTDPNAIFDWLEIKQEDRELAMMFFAQLTMMPPEEIDKLHGISFEAWVRPFNIPRSLYAFLVSNCCDGMFMVPVDQLEAAEAIASLQDMFLRHGGVFCRGGYGKVAEAYCEAVRRHGGTVLMKAKTDRILVADNRVTGVRTSQGTFHAPIVVSNAGLQPTMLKLVGEPYCGPDYLQYVKRLVPSWALLGHRYFLREPVTDAAYGVVFSDTSPWSLERLNQAHAGGASREGVVYFEVPSNYDPEAAPPGKQVMLTGSFCPPSPQMTQAEIAAWAKAGEGILFKALPKLEAAIEDKELYTPKDVSNLTRESVLPGHGGETIGLGQIVGQCGPNKPSIEAPIHGLFIVGCDAGGTGVGTQQAIESGMNVADAVLRYRQAHDAGGGMVAAPAP
jgi:phytoene dehydrogenase-like protein